MKTVSIVLSLALAAAASFAADGPGNLRCEWRVNPRAVADPCPEFYWECDSQGAFRVLVADSAAALKESTGHVWDSGKREGRLPIVEYAGRPLASGVEYYWLVQVWDRQGRLLGQPAAQHFRLDVRPMRHHLPSIRTFINFAGNPKFAGRWLDLCFRKEAKQAREEIITLRYGLVCTMVLPHPSTGKPPGGKARELAAFCVARGLSNKGIAEDMFCHFAQDTPVRLHVGAERASNPLEVRVCPGWDPANDRNGDGEVDDAEFADLVDPKARARRRRQARIPIYYWGPPQDDFVMNVGHPAYQEFMATVHAPQIAEGYDGIYFDTVPTDVAGAGRGSPVLEYPRKGPDRDAWLRDLQMLFARMKLHRPEMIITANNWNADPMVIEGRQSEGWQRLGRHESDWRAAIDTALDIDRRGKMQLIQYNPIFHPRLASFGEKLAVGHDRDKIFALATYLLAHGDFTYFGVGSHPYGSVSEHYFPAMRCDIGKPEGQYYLFCETERGRVEGAVNLLSNGDFETSDAKNKPTGWQIAEPVELDKTLKRQAAASVRITSKTPQINNINKQYLRLQPHTAYTLIAWAKVQGVKGQPGAQVYPYEFDDARGHGMLTWQGTHDWSRRSMVFQTGDDVEGRICFRMYGATGTVWFDDLQLVPGTVVVDRVFARRYTKGLVLVKPYVGGPLGERTRTAHKLPGRFCPLRVDGTLGEPIGEVGLRTAEAAVLVKAPAASGQAAGRKE